MNPSLRVVPPPPDEIVRALCWDKRIRAMAPVLLTVDMRVIANPDGSPAAGFAAIANDGYRRHGGIVPVDRYAVARALLLVCTLTEDQQIALWTPRAWASEAWAYRLGHFFHSGPRA